MSEPTEEASPKRLSRARERGQVAQSRDAVTAAALAAAAGAILADRDALPSAFRAALAVALAAARTPSGAGPSPVTPALSLALQGAARALAPPLGAAVLAAGLAGALLTGFLFAPGAATPDLSRLDPFQSLARFAKPRTYVEPLVHTLKGILFLYLGFTAARALAPAALAAVRATPAGFAALLGEISRALVLRLVGAALLLAGLDVLYRRWQFAQDQRMTREDQKREHKESEGDPHTKHAREKLHKELLAEAQLDRVRKASFVVTNPTHYAVALAWDEETMEAPALVAKGEGVHARRIIDEAIRAGIPVLRDAPLARSLHELELDDAIPEALYEAVAAVVGYLSDGGDPESYEPDGE